MSVVVNAINASALTVLHDTGKTYFDCPVVLARLSSGEDFNLFLPAGTPAKDYDDVLRAWGVHLYRTIWL